MSHVACLIKGVWSFYLDMYIFFQHVYWRCFCWEYIEWNCWYVVTVTFMLQCCFTGAPVCLLHPAWTTPHAFLKQLCNMLCSCEAFFLGALPFWGLLPMLCSVAMSVTLLWPLCGFEKVVLSIALILSLYFVRTYNHLIRQLLEELIFLGVIYILPLFCLSAVSKGFAVTMFLSPYVMQFLLIYFWCGWYSTSIPFKFCFSSGIENSWFDGLCVQ